VCLSSYNFLLFFQEGDHVWIHLRDDEMVDVEHFCKSCHGKVVVHRPIDPFGIGIGIPGHLLPCLEILGY